MRGNDNTGIATRVRLAAAGGFALWVLAVGDSHAGPNEAMTAEQIFRKASPAVVVVIVLSPDGRTTKQATGFLVSEDGLVATNCHVIKDGRSAEVVLPNGAKLGLKGVVACNPDCDVAVLKVEGRALPFLRIAKDLPKVGAKVYAIGNPKGLTNTLSEGLISGFRDVSDVLSLLQTTTPISTGSSGGPLLGDNGEVVGITTASLVSGQNLNFAVPGKLLLAVLRNVGKPIPLSSASFPRGTSAPADDQVIDSFQAVVQTAPRSILPIQDIRGAPVLDLTRVGLEPFNIWASEKLVGKRLALRVTHKDNFRLARRTLREGFHQMSFSDPTKPFGLPVTLYEVDARVGAEQAALLAELGSGGTVEIGGTIVRYKLSWTRVSRDVRGVSTHVDGVTIQIDLENLTVQRYSPPRAQPASRPTPQVLSPEERAAGRIRLAKSYLGAGARQRAIQILNSVIEDFPGTSAASLAQDEIRELTPRSPKKQ